MGEVVIVRRRWEREVGIKREYSEGVGGGVVPPMVAMVAEPPQPMAGS